MNLKSIFTYFLNIFFFAQFFIDLLCDQIKEKKRV